MAKASKPQSGESVLQDILSTLKPGQEPNPQQKAAQQALAEYQQRKQEMGASVKQSVVSNVSLEKEIKKTNILLTKLITTTSDYNTSQNERTDSMIKLLKSIKDGLFGENYRESLRVKREATVLPANDNEPGKSSGGGFGNFLDSLLGSFSGGAAGAAIASFLPGFLKGPVLKFGLIGGMASIIYSRLSDNLKQSLNEWGINDSTILPIAAALSFIPARYLAMGGIIGGLTYWLFDKLNDNVKASLEEYGITAGTTGAAAGIAATIASVAIGMKGAIATAAEAIGRFGSFIASSITPSGSVGQGLNRLGAGLNAPTTGAATSVGITPKVAEAAKTATSAPWYARAKEAGTLNKVAPIIEKAAPAATAKAATTLGSSFLKAIPFVGDAAMGYLKYQETGSVGQGVAASVGSLGGRIAGGIAGSVAGPVGTIAGQAAGGYAGSEIAAGAYKYGSDMVESVTSGKIFSGFGTEDKTRGAPIYDTMGNFTGMYEEPTVKVEPEKPSIKTNIAPQPSSSTVKMITQTDDRARKEGGSSTPVIVNKGGDTINNITNAGNNNGAAGSPSREYNPWDNLIIGHSWSPI